MELNNVILSCCIKGRAKNNFHMQVQELRVLRKSRHWMDLNYLLFCSTQLLLPSLLLFQLQHHILLLTASKHCGRTEIPSFRSDEKEKSGSEVYFFWLIRFQSLPESALLTLRLLFKS